MPYTHLSDKEVAKMDDMLKSKKSPKQIWKQVQHDRKRSGGSGPSLAAVHRFTGGRSYKRNAILADVVADMPELELPVAYGGPGAKSRIENEQLEPVPGLGPWRAKSRIENEALEPFLGHMPGRRDLSLRGFAAVLGLWRAKSHIENELLEPFPGHMPGRRNLRSRGLVAGRSGRNLPKSCFWQALWQTCQNNRKHLVFVGRRSYRKTNSIF